MKNITFYVVHCTGQERGELTEQHSFKLLREAVEHYDRQRDCPAIIERHYHSGETLSNGIPVTRRVNRLKSKNI